MVEPLKAVSPPKLIMRSSLRAFGPDGAFREGLRSAFNLEPSDVGPLRLSALGGCAVIAAYGIATPLLEVVALSLGIDLLPLVHVGQTFLCVAVNPLYQYAQRWVLPIRLIGIAYRVIATLLLALTALAASWPHSRAVAYCLAVYGGIVAVYPPVLYDSFLASVHTRPEAKRVYGIIYFAKQSGLLLGSFVAGLLFERFGPQITLVACAMYEATVHLVHCRSASFDEGEEGSEGAENGKGGGGRCAAGSHDGRGDDSGGHADCDAPDSQASGARAESCCSFAFGGVCIIARDRTLRWLAAQHFVSAMITSGIWYERAELLTSGFASDAERVEVIAKLQLAYGVITLPVQLLLFARLMRSCGYRSMLAVTPCTLIVGLITSIVHPGLAAILVLDTLRRASDYSISMPALDTLYCDLHSDTLWLGRPVIKTLIGPLATLCAAAVFTLSCLVGVQPRYRQCWLLLLSLALTATHWRLSVLGGRSERPTSELEKPRQVLGVFV
ncbi:hypothetical protein EMIHUDRAFT_120410 [Emiliania huxleyi CCMP1516]|uniref:Major facilitator superfamily associated domain-containing protein n=2 Tax=Emiliania huxleyi TaxID=2903 RepID=A0A0D3IIY1_EMIH1|nr:hypothetical protein EMIHUDRAFT_120410 [Emiliania huxleyi CCMP1516]EOD11216.1 hypothetical protein EMIHUDRAFT_120410 [Emiliania huxleyi CCMP1516]|eukprot:XP_005763645.1 hypothetical protein EMIHUDRAFT_120410 [Emiliania huxleyi CCMP1516]